jgi:hypothetical protein
VCQFQQESFLTPAQLSYDLAVKQLNLQREDLRTLRNQAAFAAAVSGLVASVFSSMLDQDKASAILSGNAFLGLNVASLLLFVCFGGALAYAIRVQVNWQKVTFDLNPHFIISETEAGKSLDDIQMVLARDAESFFDENEPVLDDAKCNLRMSLILSWSQIPLWLLLIY